MLNGEKSRPRDLAGVIDGLERGDVNSEQDDTIGATLDLGFDQVNSGAALGQGEDTAGGGERQQHRVQTLPSRLVATLDLGQDNI